MQSKRADIRIINSETLSDNWYNLKKYTFDLQRSDGDWQRQEREVYDRGNGATILLYNRDSKTVILTRQFRFPVFINGHEEDLIEAAAGLLDNLDPESRIKADLAEHLNMEMRKWPTGIPLFIYSTAQNAHVPPQSYSPGCRLLT